MPAIHETAYPRFKPYLSAQEQEEIFKLSPEELSLLNSKTKTNNQQSRFGFALLLKCYQYLGRPIQIETVDNPIKRYVAKQINIDKDIDVIHYPAATFKRHKDIIREYLSINMDSHARRKVMKKAAIDAATTKEDLVDIINCILEELILNHFELPAFQGMVRLARAARTLIHYGHYRRISQLLSAEQKQRIDTILSPSEETTKIWTWQAIKREPKSPTPKNMKLFMDYVSQLKQLRQQFLVNLDFILPSRLEHLRDEAMVTDQADMRKVGELKRYALFVILIYMKSASAMDDLVQTLLVWIRKIENKAKEKLRDYLLEHSDESDQLILTLYQILLTVKTDASAQNKLEEIEKQLGGKADEIIQACREHLGLVGDKHLSWMLKPYRDKRGLLFNLLENLTIYSSHEDKAIETALKFIQHHRSSHKEWIEIKAMDAVPVDLSILSEAWFKLVTGKNKGEAITQIHRHYYELAVFYVLAGDLNCSDAYVENAFIYDDPNKQFITWEEFDDSIDDYCKVTQLPKQSDAFFTYMKEKNTRYC
ncbi:MAG: DUF4158 domain-containing protein [Gammaproteobacteria bacterium]|nr:DUF4158 domain-containing protein [Gammaproteobacteria bacterium]